ncbi:MAG: hypothetical protein J2P36_07535 [Ktedonobacteraceae bacterium]|nr:hypothetical protein [Ktedonobacteraceae bacterium]
MFSPKNQNFNPSPLGNVRPPLAGGRGGAESLSGGRLAGGQIIKRGILISFHPQTYTADVLIIEATSAFLQNIPIACHLDGTSALSNALCAVLFFDEQNHTDAVILAAYPNGSQGIPTPSPGRVTFITPAQQISASVINSGTTSTYTIAGSGGIPAGALGILFKASFTGSAAPAHIDLAAHGGDLGKTCTIGATTAVSQTLNGSGILPLSTDGKIDIKASGANCTVNLYTYGYCF